MSKSKKGDQSSIKSTFASCVPLWFRADLTREAAEEYWRGPHAQLVGRNPGFSEYRQHHFYLENRGVWPEIPGVETNIPAERRIDGIPEVMLDGILGALKVGKTNKLVYKDEANVFARTILYAGLPGWGRWYRSGYGEKIGARSFVLLRRRPDIKPSAFRKYVNNTSGPSLARFTEIKELRSQVFIKWSKSSWDTPGVAHDNPPEHQFHAAFILGFPNEDAMKKFFSSQQLGSLASELKQHCSAIHAYRVSATYAYVVDGRTTLPQVKPEPKPPLEPHYRTLPAPPPRTFQKKSASSFGKTRLLGGEACRKPEDVVADAEGRLICGVEGGAILRIDPVTGKQEVLGNTGGRPLGLEVLRDGNILICDAHRGLLKLDCGTSSIESLVHWVDDVPLRFCSNVTAAGDGTLWFTESTSRFDFEHFLGAMYEHRPSGRLFRRDPDGHVEVILDGLYFANGITLTQDESALIFAETDGYRLSRFWLKGPKSGQREILVDNMPGFPDNISRCKDGKFWVAIPSPRNPLLDRLGRSPGWIRKLIWRVPDKLTKPPEKSGTIWAMAFDEQGRLVEDMQDCRNDYHYVTGVAEANGYLYLASVERTGLLAIELPK